MKTVLLTLALLFTAAESGGQGGDPEAPSGAELDRARVRVEWNAPRTVFQDHGGRERASRHLALSGRLSLDGDEETGGADWSEREPQRCKPASRQAAPGSPLRHASALKAVKAVCDRIAPQETSWDSPEHRAEAAQEGCFRPIRKAGLQRWGELTLLIARYSGQRPDWSGQLDGYDTAAYPATKPCMHGPLQAYYFDDFDPDDRYRIGSDGLFEVLVDLPAIRRLVGRTGAYQVGLLLSAERHSPTSPRKLAFHYPEHSAGRLLGRSIELLPIHGPDPLSPLQSAINGAPAASAWCYEPVGLVRAVNRLHELGFEGAVRELRDYLVLAQFNSFGWRTLHDADPNNPDSAEHTRFFAVVRLLFEPASPDSAPYPTVSSGMVALDGGANFPGELYPLVLARDLPFFMPRWLRVRSGHDTMPATLLEWAVEHGKLRAQPLRPPDDPCAAIEQLEQWSDRLPAGNDPRRQLWIALEEVTGLPVPRPRVRPRGDWVGPAQSIRLADWQRLRAAAARLELRWDEKTQSYKGN